jgi:ATP-dependent Clp protease ATP-binding subunit ClpA
MQRYISQPLANEILKGRFRKGDKIKVDLKGEEIIFSRIG